MMRVPGNLGLIAVTALTGAAFGAYAQTQELVSRQTAVEDYVREAMPPGFRVITAELDGPVFADPNGKTMYIWPLNGLRNGDVGERQGAPTCDDTVHTTSSGLQSPYPGGLRLPEASIRPSCAQVWPPVYAPESAKDVGKFTVVTRKDGRKQWAHNGYALYTSVVDQKPGDVLGGMKRSFGGNGYTMGARRFPAAPAPNLPPQFMISDIDSGRLLVMAANDQSVYISDKDTPAKSNCDTACRQEFQPVLAPEHVRPVGEWAIIENSPGAKQWTYRGKPLYTRAADRIAHSLEGGDVPGWHNVWTQKAPPPPKEFTVHANRIGYVLGDEKGRTIYVYNCNDDALDQQDCSHPTQPQAYRLAISGKGSAVRAVQNFPYVLAAENARSETSTWSIIHIDPTTGRKAEAGQEGALRVWAYRDRPIYLCALDAKPGDIECDSWGETFGLRNGYRAFWLRDDFGGNHG
jgi:predicted lipoprotein with Yx(FWY)xxD motif